VSVKASATASGWVKELGWVTGSASAAASEMAWVSVKASALAGVWAMESEWATGLAWA
jgi:hypothetical protein